MMERLGAALHINSLLMLTYGYAHAHIYKQSHAPTCDESWETLSTTGVVFEIKIFAERSGKTGIFYFKSDWECNGKLKEDGRFFLSFMTLPLSRFSPQVNGVDVTNVPQHVFFNLLRAADKAAKIQIMKIPVSKVCCAPYLRLFTETLFWQENFCEIQVLRFS